MTGQILFNDPHPLGLPAFIYSHPIDVLGSGAFGMVYLCCRRTPQPDGVTSAQAHSRHAVDVSQDNSMLSEWVAVKIYKPIVQCDPRDLEYLKREAVNQRRLNHEHVIGFKEVGLTTDMRLYLTLEYADSGSLKQWLSDHGGRLSESSARWFAQQLVYGLAYCHAHGVYNRDIKPANLLLHSNRDGPHPLEQPLLKVADFGLCKSSTDSAPKSKVGSPTYMAPELFSGRPYDGRKADVFSCGVVLYQMFFGALPFHRTLSGRPLDFNRNFREIMDNMRQENWQQLLPASATTAPPGCPPPPPPSPWLLDLLHGMLRYDPDERMTLLAVMHHPWYRVGLPDETYQLVLSGVTGVDQRPQPATSQSVDLIEAEFARIIQNCESCHQTAMLRAS
ncbi:hypothetical protein Vafri_1391 [Volvox africanus]|nr:hypothetical protein Vafri_1391 [Volvox africanus]